MSDATEPTEPPAGAEAPAGGSAPPADREWFTDAADNQSSPNTAAAQPAHAAPNPGTAGPGETGSQPPAPGANDQPIDVESLVGSLESVTGERDSYLADLQRVQAEFSNYRRQATKRQSDTIEHAASGLAQKLLPILDACEAALMQGATDVEPIQGALLETLRKEGLEVLAEAGEPFDPERHEAVMHEEGDGTEPAVAEVMRAGYVWNGRVLRPAMVRVKG